MVEIKISAKYEGFENLTFYDKPTPGSSSNQGTQANYYHFISQETITVNGEKVPKWEIFIWPGHPEWEKLENSIVGVDDTKDEGYIYEISFVNSEKLTKENWGQKLDKRLRFFSEKEHNITITSNFYSHKLEKLKKLDNLIPGEEQKWRSFIASFRQELNRLTNENTSKYQKGKEFIEKLEAELNKKTGKGNDNSREREREREREQKEQPTGSSSGLKRTESKV